MDERDLDAWAARIRPHFEPHLQDTAERVARVFAEAIGPQVKQLRPETRLADVIAWVEESRSAFSLSLDWVELMMVLEEEIGREVTDEFAETFERRTFRELAEHLHADGRGLA